MALSGGGCGRRRLRGRRPIAALVHELVELGTVLGGAQPIEEVAELALLLVELAQGLLAVLVDGDVATALMAPAMTAAPGAEFVARVTASGAAVGSRPMAVAAVPRAKHASTPFQIDEKGQADRPEHDEAHDHQGDPGGPGNVVQSFHQARHGGLPCLR